MVQYPNIDTNTSIFYYLQLFSFFRCEQQTIEYKWLVGNQI